MPTIFTMPDSYSVVHDQVLNIAAANGVLHNDMDMNFLPLSVSAVNGNASAVGNTITLTSGATLTMQSNGSFILAPAAHSTTSEQFQYTATNGSDSATGSVTITITNMAPTAMNEQYSIAHDQPLDIQAADGLLANDQDFDGDSLTVTITQQPQHGTLTMGDEGGFIYITNAGYLGDDSFAYQNSDGIAPSNQAWVTIHVTNAMPTAAEVRYRYLPNTPFVMTADLGLLNNSSDPDGDLLTVTTVTQPMNGTVTANVDGSFTYTPSAGSTADDSFMFTISDNVGATAMGMAWLSTGSVARPDAYQVHHNDALDLAADVGILANDDPLTENATASVFAQPMQGNLTFNADGSFHYEPTQGYVGQDQFTYQIDGSTGPLTYGLVKIDVTNEAPIAVSDFYEITPGMPLSVGVYDGLLANDYDREGDNLTVMVTEQPLHGYLNVNSDGSFTYTPQMGWQGNDSAMYKVIDSHGAVSDPVPVEFEMAQAQGNNATVSGTVTYGANANQRFPVREANITLQGQGALGWRNLLSTTTSDEGEFSFSGFDATYSAYRVVVYTSSTWLRNGNQEQFVKVSDWGSMVESPAPYRVTRPVAVGGANDIALEGSSTDTLKAFWTFDAAVTAAYGQFLALNGQRMPTISTIRYNTGGNYYNPNWYSKIIFIDRRARFNDWDVICHEYGHFFQDSGGFRFDTDVNNHDWGRTVRQVNPDTTQLDAIKVAFKEGFADFFSMYAQESDSSAPTVTFTTQFDQQGASRDMKIWYVKVEDSRDDNYSSGEEEEICIMRTLWDLYDPAGGAADVRDGRNLDNVQLGNDLFDVIRNRNFTAPGTQVAATMNDLVHNFDNWYFRDGVDRAAARVTMTRLGDVFQMNNLSPRTFNAPPYYSPEGMFIGNNQTSQWGNTANAGQIPTFWMGVPTKITLPVPELLDHFCIAFYSADYSQVVWTDNITNRVSWRMNPTYGDRSVGWTPAPDEWNVIKAANGVLHWVVWGGTSTTGWYVGGANDITIQA